MDKYVCYRPECPRAENCTLYHNALKRLAERASFLDVVSPDVLERAGGYAGCPFYYEHKLRRFARGLVWSYPNMTLAQLRDVQVAITAYFGERNTVRYRMGYEAISPEEQAKIAEIFSHYAPGHQPEYKTYEEHYVRPPRIEGKAVHKYLR